MAKFGNFVIFTIITVCLLLLLDSEVEARGGRGGGLGGRGGSRGGGRYSGSRSSSTRYSSSSRSGFRAGGLRWKQAAVVGYIYGYTRYSNRRSYRMYPDREPTICVNKFDYKRDNGTYYSYFICPKYNEPDSYKYCCGPKDRQKCCSYWQGAGRAAGTIIGILLFLATCFCCCWLWCCGKKGDEPTKFQSFKQRTWKGDSSATPMSNVIPPFTPYQPSYDNGYPNNQPDPAYPVNPGGYPTGPAPPPAYGGEAYPPQPAYPPQGDPAYPPQPGFGPPPPVAPSYPQGPGDGSVPYPLNPNQPPYPGGAPYPEGPSPGMPPPGGQPYPMGPPDAPYPGEKGPLPGAPPPDYSSVARH